VSPVRYELGLYIPKDGTRHSHRGENVKSYKETGLDIQKLIGGGNSQANKVIT
jgi:hypothetical protein